MPASPSLLIVPARFKTGKLYTQIATTSAGLVLGSSGDFNVTRATTATRVNANGLIESVASGVPRLDYYTSGGTAGCPALLVEPSAQNLVFNSQIWANANNWTLDNLTRVTGSTEAFTAPDGTTTANALSPTSGNLVHVVFSNASTQITYASGTIYSQSAFFKQGAGVAGRYVQLTFNAAAFTQGGYANFDLQAGVAFTPSGTTSDANRASSIENYGNGWYRCRLTATCNASGNTTGLNAVLITASGDTRRPTFSGTVTDVLYGWGAQLETGSIATSYIPTTAAAVTRNADVITLTGAVSGCIGQTEGTIYAEVDVQKTAAAFRNIIEVTDGTSSNRFFARLYDDSGTQRLEVALINSGGFAARYQNLAMPAGIYKVAFAYALNNFACFVNGIQNGSTDTSGNCSASYSTINLGSAAGNVSFFNDRIRSAALYTTRLTDSELAALTT
jgi:hypothetical protein